MNILMITSFFAPDTAIAAVRPYMYAKYLSIKGHKITVLRSGEILSSIDETFNCERYGVKIISYLGNSSTIEKYKQGIIDKKTISPRKSRISIIPIKARIKLSHFYHFLMKPLEYKVELNHTNNYYNKQKEAIQNIRNEHFDIIWTTYGRLENIFAGEYASKVFGCPWILDLRDWIIHDNNFFIRMHRRSIEKRYVLSANATVTVSNAYTTELKEKYPSKEILAINNGFEPIEDKTYPGDTSRKLVLCYTGSMYTGKLNVCPLFRALKILYDKKLITLEEIVFLYAGSEYEYIFEQAQRYSMEDILNDLGYLNKKEIQVTQAKADIFVVAARCFNNNKGEVTGKFYEGIRAHKPIVTIITGNSNGSELYNMQQKYNYGFCYEEASGEKSFQSLCTYLLTAYQTKQNGCILQYNPSSRLFEDFQYSNLTNKLELLMKCLIANNK